MSLKRKLNVPLHRIRTKLADSVISDTKSAQLANTVFHSYLTPESPNEEIWATYNGKKIRIHPNDWVASRIYKYGVSGEPKLREFILDNTPRDGIAVDIGAHIGHHSLTMRKAVGENGRVFAFEPNPTNAKLIEKTINKNNFSNFYLITKAASSSSGTTKLSIRDRENTGTATVEPVKSNAVEQYSVEKTTLDEFTEKADVQNVDLLKIDVEGHERSVIEGGENTLPRTGTVIIETHDLEERENLNYIYDTMTDVFDDVRILSNEGTLSEIRSKKAIFNESVEHLIFS